MGGGLLNLVAKGNNNVILNGNPEKTFFKKSYAKYTNFALQRFKIPYSQQNKLSLFADSKFEFNIPQNGDLLLDTFFSIELPDIYSPIYTIPIPYQNGQPEIDLSGLTYCQPYEFKWIENIGAQLIKKVTYLIDGRPIQEYTGQYLYCKSKRDLDSGKQELFNQMIGNVPELTDPANAVGNNGNYPSASWGGLTRNQWSNGLEPSIRGRRIYVPLYLWETFSSYQSFPLISIHYSKLEIHVECRPVSEIIKVRDINYFERWVSDISSVTQLQCNPNNTFKYYNPPFIAPNFNDQRYSILYFTEMPPEGSRCLGDVSYNRFETLPNGEVITKTTEDILREIKQIWYINKGSWNHSMTLYTTYAFLGDPERNRLSGLPQRYLIKQVYEKDVPFTQGVHKVNVDATGLTVSWMWFFQRSDVVLRNEWSNYSNWPYNNDMPYPCVLGMDLSFTLTDIGQVNTSYITPPRYSCTNNSESVFNPCLQYITGPIHPENQKEIMLEWGLYCDKQERESILPAEVNNYLDKYLKIEGDSEDGIYCYNFNIDKPTKLEPSGGMNMSKFSEVSFEFTTIDPYREMLPNTSIEDGGININDNCLNLNQDYLQAWRDPDAYFKGASLGGAVVSVTEPTYIDFNYNFNLHIMEERYNILEFSGGMAKLLFPS